MAQLTQYSDVVEDVWAYLDALARRCGDAGLYPWNVWLDPGLGFAKTPDQSVECPGGLWQHSLAVRGVGRDRCTSCCTEMMPHPPRVVRYYVRLCALGVGSCARPPGGVCGTRGGSWRVTPALQPLPAVEGEKAQCHLHIGLPHHTVQFCKVHTAG